MTTGEAIRVFCQECVSSHQKKVIENCGGEMVLATKKPCALFKYRLKGRGTLKAIRKNCVECKGGSKEAVKECSTSDCLIHPFRFGKNPLLVGKGKSRDEMARIRALRRPLVKGISGEIQRSEGRP